MFDNRIYNVFKYINVVNNHTNTRICSCFFTLINDRGQPTTTQFVLRCVNSRGLSIPETRTLIRSIYSAAGCLAHKTIEKAAKSYTNMFTFDTMCTMNCEWRILFYYQWLMRKEVRPTRTYRSRTCGMGPGVQSMLNIIVVAVGGTKTQSMMQFIWHKR